MAELKHSTAPQGVRVVVVLHGLLAVAELKHGQSGDLWLEGQVLHGLLAVAELKRGLHRRKWVLQRVLHGLLAVAELKLEDLVADLEDERVRRSPRPFGCGRIEAGRRGGGPIGGVAVLHGLLAVAELKRLMLRLTTLSQ